MESAPWGIVADYQRQWLTLKLEGTLSNRDGFGAPVKVTSGERTPFAKARCPTSYVFQSDPRLHLGLGGKPQASHIEIHWPSGQTQVLSNVPAGQVWKVREPGESGWPKNP